MDSPTSTRILSTQHSKYSTLYTVRFSHELFACTPLSVPLQRRPPSSVVPQATTDRAGAFPVTSARMRVCAASYIYLLRENFQLRIYLPARAHLRVLMSGRQLLFPAGGRTIVALGRLFYHH